MSLVDRFICRREGHIPAVQLAGWSGLQPQSYITRCRRCGKVYEVEVKEPDAVGPFTREAFERHKSHFAKAAESNQDDAPAKRPTG